MTWISERYSRTRTWRNAAEITEIRETVAKTAAKEQRGRHANGVAAASPDDHYGGRCPFPIFERHPSFPPLSDSVDVVFNEKQGRHVIARKVRSLAPQSRKINSLMCHFSKSTGRISRPERPCP